MVVVVVAVIEAAQIKVRFGFLGWVWSLCVWVEPF